MGGPREEAGGASPGPEPARPLLPLGAALGAAGVSAALQVLSFPPADLGFLILGAFVPWFLAIEGRRLRPALALSFAVGLLFFFFGLFWLTTVSVAPLLVITPPLAGFAAAAGAGALALRRSWRLPWAAAAPLAFVTLDILRSFVLTGFPWLYAGHALAGHPLWIQTADLGGAYAVTALVLAVNGAAADLAAAARGRMPRRRAAAAAGAAALALGAALAYGAARMRPGEETGPEVVLVQGNVPQDVKESGRSGAEIWRTHVLLTLEGAAGGADLVVWPETMVPHSASTDAETLRGLFDLSRDVGAPMLVGTVWYDRTPDGRLGSYNSAILVGTGGAVEGRYDKIRRVPGSEYIPWRRWFPALERVLVAGFGYVPSVERGAEPAMLETADRGGRTWRFGVLVCYESVFPWLARGFARRGADFLVNVTNDGWFKGSAELEQVMAASCFRAVENRMTVVRSGNTGITALVGPDGKPYRVLEREGRRKQVEGALRGRIRVDGRGTAYRAAGDLPAFACAAATFALWAWAALRGFRKRGHFSLTPPGGSD